MDHENDLRGIGITPRERLERIEKGIDTLLDKLDSKATEADMMAIAIRVATLEASAARTTELAELKKLAERTDRKVAYYAGALAIVGPMGFYAISRLFG